MFDFWHFDLSFSFSWSNLFSLVLDEGARGLQIKQENDSNDKITAGDRISGSPAEYVSFFAF